MVEFLKQNLKDINEIVQEAAIYLKIQPSIIEKDLWNCYFLDYLFNRSRFKDFYIFKGGTSLSKCYNLINRYSEDLDVVLDSNISGINLEEKMENFQSRTQRDKFIKNIINEANDIW